VSLDEDLSPLVEFKLFLVRTLEDYVIRELGTAARKQGRRLPAVTQALLRSGATTAVAELAPAELGAFARGDDWATAFEGAVRSGAWARLVETTIQHSFSPEAG
jgi:hypothetical protein